MKNNMVSRIFAVVCVLTLLVTLSLSFCIYAQDNAADDGTASENAENNEENDEKDEKAVKSKFEPIAFVDNLKYMGIGMLGIFIVIGLIVISISILNKIFSRAPKSEQ